MHISLKPLRSVANTSSSAAKPKAGIGAPARTFFTSKRAILADGSPDKLDPLVAANGLDRVLDAVLSVARVEILKPEEIPPGRRAGRVRRLVS